LSEHPPHVTVNGRDYCWPAAPTVVICLDGSEPGYIETAAASVSRTAFSAPRICSG
jgi:hypothetical protein